jgi:thiol-disulfide isomerase/thioredoxin
MTEMLPPSPNSQRPSPVLVIFLILPLLGIIASLMMVIQNERQQNPDVVDLPAELERRAAALINFTAPSFNVTDLEGKPVSLDDYQGRIVFLNFWSTDCPPCVREMPAFAQFASEQGNTGAAVLTVNMGETPEAVRDFFAKIDVQGLRVAMDTDLVVGTQYGIIARPVTYIIDGEGIVRSMKAGEITIEEMDDYVFQLSKTAAS